MLSNLFGGLGPVAYNIADTKPIIPYSASGPSLETAGNMNALFNKRDALQSNKEKITDNVSSMYKRGMFGPFSPKFGPIGPMSPKFGPMTPFSSAEMMTDYDLDKVSFSRKRRSIGASSAASDNSISDNKSQITGTTGTSSYSKDSQIIENMSTAKSADNGIPKEYLPAMFGPFGPGGPFGSDGSFGPSGPFGPSGSFGPVVDPNMLIAKKSAFLDTLFKNLATSTPATITDIPTPKSTIVPPNFWIPSSVIPGPTEYTSKISNFLDKLFDSLKINATTEEASDSSDLKSNFMRSLKSDVLPDKAVRSVDDASSIIAAKDAIVDAILSELGDLKGDMITTLNDLIAYEKATAAAAPAAKKPFKPFSGMFPFAKPTIDPTLPFKERMAVLSQVFDMLTDLQRNITIAANNAITTNTNTPSNSPDNPNNPELSKIPVNTAPVDTSSINSTLLNAILNKISAAQVASPASYSTSFTKENPIMSRALPKEPTSFWVSYPESSVSTIKRQVQDDLLPYLQYENDNDQHDHRQYTRGVQMQMHQGYQSLPAGSIESVQAGGGSTPEHQGGGIKLLVSNFIFERH